MEKDVAEEERTGIYDCEIPECPFSTNDWLKLAEHDAKHQDHFRFFLCEYCDKPNKKYKNEYEFKMHLASHADEFKFYSCYKCPGFQSRDVNDVLSHLAIEHNIHYHPEPNAEIFKTKNKKVEKILEVKSSRNKRKSGEDRDHPISHYVPYPEADPLNPFPPRKELTIKFSREIYNQVIREDLARQEIRSSTPKTMLDKSKSKRRPSADKTARAPASHAAKIKSDESSDEKEKVRSPSIEGEKKPRENEGEKEMEELDMGKLVSQALEGSDLDTRSKCSLVDFIDHLTRFFPSDKMEKLENRSRESSNMPFTFNEGQTDKILLHPSGNMDSAVLALNHFFAFVFSSCYAGDLSNKANTISPGQLRDFCFHPDDLNWLVYLCLSDPLIARIRFVHTAPVPNNIKKGEIYAVLEKSSDLRNFATAHWAWFHRDYLSWTHLENIRPNENSMNCSTVMKSIDFYCDIEYQILIKATVDYIDSKGQTHPGRRLRVIHEKEVIKEMYNKKLEERNHKVALNDQGEIIDRMIFDDKKLVLDRISLGLGVAGAVPYDKLDKLTSIVRQLEKKEKKSSTDNKKDVTAERSSAEQRDESRRIMQSLYVDAVSGLNAFSKYTHQMLDDRQESDEKLRNLFGELNKAGASIATTMRAIGDQIGTPWDGQERVDGDVRDEEDENEDEERPAKRFKCSEPPPQTQTGKKKKVADEDSESDDLSSPSSEESYELAEIAEVASGEHGDSDSMDIDEQSPS